MVFPQAIGDSYSQTSPIEKTKKVILYFGWCAQKTIEGHQRNRNMVEWLFDKISYKWKNIHVLK